MVPLTVPPSSWCESVINLFILFRHEFEVVFCVNHEKISFSRPDFGDSKIAIWGLTFLTNFYKRVHLLFKKRHVSDCQ